MIRESSPNLYDLEPIQDVWTHEKTGEIIPCMAKVTRTGNYLGVEGVYSQDEDMRALGYTEKQIKDMKERDTRPDPIAFNVEDDETSLFYRAKRGKIQGFTRASQARLIKSLSLWEPVGRLVMLTLTYPEKWPDGKTVQKHFKRFRMRMMRQQPELNGCWKLEYQTRGAPHFHLVLDSTRYKQNILPLRKWVRKTWNECRTDGENPNFQCEFARKPEHAKYYLTKEIGKTVQCSKKWQEEVEQHIDHVGRFWGWINKKNLNREGDQFYVPAKLGKAIRDKIQQISIRDMAAKGLVEIMESGQAYFKGGKRAGEIVDPERIRAWQLTRHATHRWENIVEEIEAETGLNFYDEALPIFDKPKPPPKTYG